MIEPIISFVIKVNVVNPQGDLRVVCKVRTYGLIMQKWLNYVKLFLVIDIIIKTSGHVIMMDGLQLFTY